ncbi:MULTISPECIES: hypothetical protein [Micrococcus]|uniref:hypothetical protein n=1 Tax=Micrococcus TaxID=1269 RepID=UPI000B867A84|nr:hypothetical protein [Micrococcus terreus]
MPRSNRPRRTARVSGARKGGAGDQRSQRRPGEPDAVEALLGLDTGYQQQDHHDGGWHVRQIPSWRAVKDYTCPGCGRSIRAGAAHLVAWRSDWIFGDDRAGEDRRHWHPICWRTRRHDGR